MSIEELVTYFKIIKKRWWIIALLVGVTLGVMVTLSYLAPPVYQATGSFKVTTPLPAEVSLYSEFRTGTSRDEIAYTRNNFISVLKSPYVVGQVVDKLGLNLNVDKILESMVIKTEDDSDFVKLKIEAENPQVAADLTNTLMDIASQFFAERSSGSLTADKEFIQQKLQEIKVELDQARAELVQFQLENRIGMMDQLLTSQHTLIRQLSLSRDAEEAEGNVETVENYDKVITRRERELQDLILLNSEYEMLQDSVNRIEAVYSNLLDREVEAKLKENEVLSARFIQTIPAREPAQPLARFNIKVLLLGGIVSLALGTIIVFILEYLDRVAAERVTGDPATMPVTNTRHQEQNEAIERAL